ncbi:MAG: membrane lipoprotein lipid attachment site-containing protein [Ruminococcus sp.]|nr:membrane lipoprotein lipid attachment site-containing protein [Ruminococcus sp.]
MRRIILLILSAVLLASCSSSEKEPPAAKTVLGEVTGRDAVNVSEQELRLCTIHYNKDGNETAVTFVDSKLCDMVKESLTGIQEKYEPLSEEAADEWLGDAYDDKEFYLVNAENKYEVFIPSDDKDHVVINCEVYKTEDGEAGEFYSYISQYYSDRKK